MEEDEVNKKTGKKSDVGKSVVDKGVVGKSVVDNIPRKEVPTPNKESKQPGFEESPTE